MQFHIENVTDYVAGLAGSIIALIFLKPPALQLIAYIFGGGLSSYYLTPLFVEWLGTAENPTAFLVGLFSMTTTAKVFTIIEHIDVKNAATKIAEKMGLK